MIKDNHIRIKQYEQAADEKVSLDGIKWLRKWDVCVQCDSAEEAEALRARLAQPEQEPVAWPDAPMKIYLQVCDDDVCEVPFSEHDEVSWCQGKINGSDVAYIRADTAPPQREWVGLTDEETEQIVDAYWNDPAMFVDAIEAKLKEKNG